MDMLKLGAKDLMQSDAKTVGKTTSLSAAAKMMQELRVSSLIVEPDDEGDAFGIITRKDIHRDSISRLYSHHNPAI